MAAEVLRVVQGRGIDPARQEVEILGVIHRMEPHRVLVPQMLHIAAGKEAAGEIPIVNLAIRHDLAGCREYPQPPVLGFSGANWREVTDPGEYD